MGVNTHAKVGVAERNRLPALGRDGQRPAVMPFGQAEQRNHVADQADRHVVVDEADRVRVSLEEAQSLERLEKEPLRIEEVVDPAGDFASPRDLVEDASDRPECCAAKSLARAARPVRRATSAPIASRMPQVDVGSSTSGRCRRPLAVITRASARSW